VKSKLFFLFFGLCLSSVGRAFAPADFEHVQRETVREILQSESANLTEDQVEGSQNIGVINSQRIISESKQGKAILQRIDKYAAGLKSANSDPKLINDFMSKEFEQAQTEIRAIIEKYAREKNLAAVIEIKDQNESLVVAIDPAFNIKKITANSRIDITNDIIQIWDKGMPPAEQPVTSQKPSTEGEKAQESEVDRLVRLGDKYYFGDGVAEDRETAEDYYRQAIRTYGDYRAHIGLGACLHDIFIEQFGETDDKYKLRKLVWDATNQYDLGLIHMLYNTTDKDRFYFAMGRLKSLMENFDEEDIGKGRMDNIRDTFERARKLASERWGIEY
jgi:hypothetical protein